MELVPAQGEQTAQRDVKAVHGNVCSQDGILNCTDVSLQRASKGFKACQSKIFGSLSPCLRPLCFPDDQRQGQTSSKYIRQIMGASSRSGV